MLIPPASKPVEGAGQLVDGGGGGVALAPSPDARVAGGGQLGPVNRPWSGAVPLARGQDRRCCRPTGGDAAIGRRHTQRVKVSGQTAVQPAADLRPAGVRARLGGRIGQLSQQHVVRGLRGGGRRRSGGAALVVVGPRAEAIDGVDRVEHRLGRDRLDARAEIAVEHRAGAGDAVEALGGQHGVLVPIGDRICRGDGAGQHHRRGGGSGED
jgi:hypothetical protein